MGAEGGTAALPGLGLGMLCWREFDTFEAALDTYRERGFFDFFEEVKVYFNSLDDKAAAFADRMGIAYAGTPENTGIIGGLKGAASSVSTDYVVLLENDLPLIEPREVIAEELALALESLKAGEVDVFRLRSRAHPGQKFPLTEKYNRYYGEGVMPMLRRLSRPGKAKRLIGGACYVHDAPHDHHPEIEPMQDGRWWRVGAPYLPWTNQSIMINRRFFLDTIVAYAEAHPTTRGAGGMPNIEIEWNNSDWRTSGYRSGVSAGILTHERI
ncbi:hypothetical protein RYZ27_07725 [Hyphomonas sp. FCG-A18]|uniref:hypothetical protein n=1 Tax=Hyphomonas sp. FCG-A18 TaxID=3080019 RepID=UPI002B2DAEE9|nr:hypothetical protein RYZ27_07725 [Hyphomonas sp. FCG-A18]